MHTFATAHLMTNNAAYESKPHIKEVTLPDRHSGASLSAKAPATDSSEDKL